MNIEKNYSKFVYFLKHYITRDGVDELIEWLDSSDAKNAPASCKYHLSVDGGYIQHSLNVFNRLISLMRYEYPDRQVFGEDGEPLVDEDGKEVYESTCPYSKETIAFVSLLHDISKVNYYSKVYKNVRNNETGLWEQVPSYIVRDDDDKLFFGSHSENSVYLLNRFFTMSYEEELAIRYHMGATENVDEASRSINAFKRSPLAMLLHTADMMSMCIDEEKVEEDEQDN